MNEYNNENCQSPFQEIMVFEDKLIIVDNFFLYCFTKEKTQQPIDEEPAQLRPSESDCGSPNCDCKEGGSMSEGFYTKCSFHSISTIAELYTVIYNLYPNYKNEILPTLPESDLSVKGENAINVTYHIEPDSVRINILFEGGEDDMIFTQEDNYTIFTLIQSPD